MVITRPVVMTNLFPMGMACRHPLIERLAVNVVNMIQPRAAVLEASFATDCGPRNGCFCESTQPSAVAVPPALHEPLSDGKSHRSPARAARSSLTFRTSSISFDRWPVAPRQEIASATPPQLCREVLLIFSLDVHCCVSAHLEDLPKSPNDQDNRAEVGLNS